MIVRKPKFKTHMRLEHVNGEIGPLCMGLTPAMHKLALAFTTDAAKVTCRRCNAEIARRAAFDAALRG
jgi:hypothetical protein